MAPKHASFGTPHSTQLPAPANPVKFFTSSDNPLHDPPGAVPASMSDHHSRSKTDAAGFSGAPTQQPPPPDAAHPLDDSPVDPNAITASEHGGILGHLPQLRIGNYVIQDKLGAGGQGTVYRAIQIAPIQRIVALKLLNLTVETAAQAEQLRKEAERAARVEHPAILPVFEFGQAADRAYLAMPLVDGGTLANLVRQRKLRIEGTPPADLHRLAILDEAAYLQEAVALVARVAHALAAVHQAQLVHRDIKPSNILLDRHDQTTVYLSDFGLARDLDNVTLLDVSSEPGTTCYMAPERIKFQKDYDEYRADVYSLGLTLYEVVTLQKGRDIPKHAPPATLAFYMLDSELTPPRLINPRISADLEAIILKATDYKSAYRYANATEMAADLDRFLAGEPVLARPLGPVTKTLRKLRKYQKWKTPLAAALAVLLTLGLVWQGVHWYAASLRSQAQRLLKEGDLGLAAHVAAQAQALSGQTPEVLQLLKELIRENLRQYRTGEGTTGFTHIRKLYLDYIRLQDQLSASPADARSARLEFANDLHLSKLSLRSDRPDTWVTFHPVQSNGHPSQVQPLYALWAGSSEHGVELAEVIEGDYWVTAYQPATGAFVELPYRPPHLAATYEVVPLVLHPRTQAETAPWVTRIEGGTFVMGLDGMPSDYEFPPHPATVSTFYLGQAEVTQQAYDDYLSEIARAGIEKSFRIFQGYAGISLDELRMKIWPNGGHPSPQQAHLPNTNLTWENAVRFAAWYGCRLPSETELEYTARRNQGVLLPPGSPPNWATAGPPWNTIHPVGSVPEDQIAVEPAGTKISGLYGNAAELTLYKMQTYIGWVDEGKTKLQEKQMPKPLDPYGLGNGGVAVRSGLLLNWSGGLYSLGYAKRLPQDRNMHQKTVGFRLARSETPKILPENRESPAER